MLIVGMTGVQAAPGLVGIHTNMAGAIPSDVDAAAFAGAAPPAGLDEEEKFAFDHVSFFYIAWSRLCPEKWGTGRRRCTGCRILRSALAAWIIDHDTWTVIG